MFRAVVGVSSLVGSLVLFHATGKLLGYMRAVLSANIYETGVIYEYDEDFDEDEHTFFCSSPDGDKGGLGAVKELKSLHFFVRNQVIPLFKDQCDEKNGGDHFATLILFSQPLSSLSENWIGFDPLASDGRPHVDSRHRTRPPRHLYGNYVVARPQLRRVPKILRTLAFRKIPEVFYEHAEEMLVDEFDALREAFEAINDRICVVVLFSWLFPCDHCAGRMIEKFGPDFRQRYPHVQRVVLTFAVYWRRMPFEKNWENFIRLKRNGFDIVRVKNNK